MTAAAAVLALQGPIAIEIVIKIDLPDPDFDLDGGFDSEQTPAFSLSKAIRHSSGRRLDAEVLSRVRRV